MENQSISSVATDFQPTTGNPQNNVGGGLQPNSANLQPTTATNSANSFNQPGINPQAFPKVNSLHVLGSQTTIPNTTTIDTPIQPAHTNPLIGFMVVAVMVIVGLLLLAKLARPKPNEQIPTFEEATDPVPPARIRPKKKKNRVKNKSGRRHR
ncbi:MAG TPA: hypothetical protein VLE74_02065 [Candidatus Saccharimonadales bacterium]|nr:hypothetical protein [Candidatus Saccharimonadales bacterium]